MYKKKNIPRGVKKSEWTINTCNKIIEELQSGEKTEYELKKKFKIKEWQFVSLLLQLTYMAPIYDYKAGGDLYLGLLK